MGWVFCTPAGDFRRLTAARHRLRGSGCLRRRQNAQFCDGRCTLSTTKNGTEAFDGSSLRPS